MKSSKVVCLGIFTFVTALPAVASPDPVPEGKTIFMSRCASCHNVNKDLTGPALAGIDERRSMDWIINFVHSSQTMVKKGDKDAVGVFEKFNKIPMPDHPDLTEDNIKSIVAYIKEEKKAGEKAKATPVKANRRDGSIPLSFSKDYWFFIAFLASVGLLIGVLLFAAKVNRLMRNPELLKKYQSG